MLGMEPRDSSETSVVSMNGMHSYSSIVQSKNALTFFRWVCLQSERNRYVYPTTPR
ncbi:hypothetical protein [Silicibacter phage DSS3phi2]|uniref:Uncharacterized protein n=1 Tax=Silicibacter phage DSS3phi2 TaxID=490912 RepID=C4NT40_9CAUD|nr:hypothetical protein DSS3P2_gp38 [Silicibacter phage DSS3phi2]ACL81306.1 hypothetical protein [Silicibacter phage DSS3phi2]